MSKLNKLATKVENARQALTKAEAELICSALAPYRVDCFHVTRDAKPQEHRLEYISTCDRELTEFTDSLKEIEAKLRVEGCTKFKLAFTGSDNEKPCNIVGYRPISGGVKVALQKYNEVLSAYVEAEDLEQFEALKAKLGK